MSEFIATIKFIGAIVFLWKRFRSMAPGEKDAWLKEMEIAINGLENADTSEKKRDSARHIISLIMRVP